MSHKTVSPKLLEDLKRDISNKVEAIKHANVYRDEKDNPAIKLLLKTLADQLDAIKRRKDVSLKMCSEEGNRFALLLLGKQEQISDIIESFEDAARWEDRYKKEIEQLEHELEYYSKLPASEES